MAVRVEGPDVRSAAHIGLKSESRHTRKVRCTCVTSSLAKCWANDGKNRRPVPGIAIETDDILAFYLLGFSLAEQPTFGPFGAARFRSTNRRRNGFHRVAPAALEDAVLESSHAGVYTLQIHAFLTRRAARTFLRQQLR